MALDYERAPANKLSRADQALDKPTSRFGLKTPALARGVEAYAKAFAEIEALRNQGREPAIGLGRMLAGAFQALALENPLTARILDNALTRNRGLANEVHSPGGMEKIVGVMRVESAALRDPEIRAERKTVEVSMSALAEYFMEDPAMEDALGRRRRALGLPEHSGQSLGQPLTRSIGRSRGMDR